MKPKLQISALIVALAAFLPSAARATTLSPAEVRAIAKKA